MRDCRLLKFLCHSYKNWLLSRWLQMGAFKLEGLVATFGGGAGGGGGGGGGEVGEVGGGGGAAWGI